RFGRARSTLARSVRRPGSVSRHHRIAAAIPAVRPITRYANATPGDQIDALPPDRASARAFSSAVLPQSDEKQEGVRGERRAFCYLETSPVWGTYRSPPVPIEATYGDG